MKRQVRRGSDQLDSDAISSQRPTSEVHRLQDVTAEAQEIRAAAVARPVHLYWNDLLDPTRTLRHDDDAVTHVDRFVDVMGDKEHRGAASLPETQHFILHTHAGKGVERAEWFVEQEHFGMVNHRPRERDALGHASREMMRKGISKRFQTHQAHEFIDLTAFLFQHTARDEAGFDVASHGEPRKKIRILKDKAPLCAWRGDWLVAYQKLALGRKSKAGDETQKSGLTTTAGTNDRYELPSRDEERHLVQSQSAHRCAVNRSKVFARAPDAQRRSFDRSGLGEGYHLITPFCQTSTRSRTLKRTVMIVEKKAAMIIRAP